MAVFCCTRMARRGSVASGLKAGPGLQAGQLVDLPTASPLQTPCIVDTLRGSVAQLVRAAAF